MTPVPDRREWLRAGAIALATALLLIAVGPSGGDVPAHLYRTLLLDRGVFVWDDLWFAGHYPIVSYSLLYYPVAEVTGNVALVAGSVVASAVLFERIAAREWGADAVWPARAFAVLAAGPLLTGTYSYAVGFAALLGALAALQARRRWLAVLCGALTIGFSPLAFVFLAIVLGAVAVSRRTVDRRFVAGLGLAAGIQLVALRLFPTGGEYPFRFIELLTVLACAGLGLAIARRAPRGELLAALFGAWMVACLVLFAVPEPVGENVTRLRSVVFALMLLAVILARPLPRPLAGVALAFALGYSVIPYWPAVQGQFDTRASQERFWAPAIGFVKAGVRPGERVEVVPTADHWEAYWIPRAGLPLARGWYRQVDIAENAVFYREPLTAAGYGQWLQRMSVRYVMLPDLRLGKKGVDRERRLLLGGESGLRPVYDKAGWRIFEVISPRPPLSGPGPAAVETFTHDRIAGRTGTPGIYRLGVRYMPYWRLRSGAVCLRRAADGMTRVEVRRPGGFELVVSLRDRSARC
jgi:hypothetical protein